MIQALVRAMRPGQWSKNVVIYAALVFDQQLFFLKPLVATTLGFIFLCAASSSVYLFNDLADLEQDRIHPKKKNRPIASGELSPRFAMIAALLLGAIAVVGGFLLDVQFGLIVVTYLILNLLYSFRLKHVVILDVLIIAAGFVLRVAAGVSLITVERFSPWLYVCTTLLALLIGFGKRRAELSLLEEGAGSHRKVLDGYSIPYLDYLIVIVSAATLMAYSLYTFSAENLPSNDSMMLTIPFVLYGIFRYLYLIHVEEEGGSPVELMFKDRALFASIVLWGLVAVSILYFRP